MHSPMFSSLTCKLTFLPVCLFVWISSSGNVDVCATGCDTLALSLTSRFVLQWIRQLGSTSVSSRHPFNSQSLTQHITWLIIFYRAQCSSIMRRHVPLSISCGMLLSGFLIFSAQIWQLTSSCRLHRFDFQYFLKKKKKTWIIDCLL